MTVIFLSFQFDLIHSYDLLYVQVVFPTCSDWDKEYFEQCSLADRRTFVEVRVGSVDAADDAKANPVGGNTGKEGAANLHRVRKQTQKQRRNGDTVSHCVGV